MIIVTELDQVPVDAVKTVIKGDVIEVYFKDDLSAHETATPDDVDAQRLIGELRKSEKENKAFLVSAQTIITIIEAVLDPTKRPQLEVLRDRYFNINTTFNQLRTDVSAGRTVTVPRIRNRV